MSSTQTKQIKERSTRPLQSQNGNSDPQSINKIQPTGEQLRIAQITSSDRADVDPEMLKKIKEVSDLTGKSTDEAWTALHDCNGDANQAVELIFEKEGEQDEWQEKKKRKKPTTVVPMNRVTQQTTTMSDNTATDTRQERMTDNDITDRSENIPRGQQRDRAPPRFQRGRGRGFNHSGANGEKDASRERGPDRRFEGGRGRRGGGGGGGGLGGRGGGRGGEGGGLAGRGRGGRGYNSNSVGMETAPHIDTWTNETAQNGRNNDTSIGAWGDTTTEEWTADEWSGSLEESLVLTRSMPSRSDVFSGAAAAAGASSSSDASQQQHQQQQQQGLQSQVFVPSSHAAGEVMTDNMTSSGYLSSTLPPNADQNSGRSVGFDLNHLLPKFSSEPYSSMTRDDESAAYLSHYTKKATECIKNAVGIGSSTMSGSSSHGDASSSSSNVVDQMGRRPTTVAQSSSNAAQQIPLQNRVKQQQQMPPHHQHHHPQQQQQMPQQQQQQHRPRLPPPSKIPSSAVEMPGSMGSAQLDVQFGNWDSSSSASASSSSAAHPPATIDASNAFLNDSSSSQQTHLSSQFSAQQNVNNAREQSSAMNLGGGGKTTTTMVGGDNMSLQHNKASGLGSMNDASSSSSSAVLAMQQEMTIGGSKPTSAYQTNAAAAAAAAQPNELGNSNKMMANPAQQQQQQQQLLSSFPTSSDDRKTIPYASQQPSNQLSGPSGSSLGSSQLGLSQLAYSSGVESAPPSVYKPSSSSAPGAGASSSSAYSSQQPSAVSGATAPYGSTLHYPSTGPQAQMHLNYPVAPGPTNQGGVYSAYSVAEQQQANFSNTAPVSYGAMATQAPTGFSGASKSYGSVADKSSNQFPASVLSQVYESSAMGNAYPTVNQAGAGMQMGYQSTGAIYPGQGGGAAAVGLSYEGLPAVSSTNAYQNPANLYRGGGGGQMPANVTNDFQSSISESSSSYPRVVQTVATSTAAPQSSTPGGGGKLSDGLSKMSVKDSSVISQQPTSYDPSSASATSASSLSSSSSNAGAANAGNVASSAAAGSTMKTMAPATTKSTAASKTAMNWPPSAVPAPMMNVNPNYMISQPPGFQLATFGYPTAQQTLPYSYEDLQILQQRYALQPAAYYDLPLQSSALPGRDLQASLTSASYVPGSDVKLAALMEPQVSVAQQQQQQQGPSAGANQQQSYPAAAAAAAAMHPGYSYYYPPAAGMVPYYTPMIPVGGVAVPMVTNPTHGATTSSTQYQKPTLYGSHAFGTGGPSQDFSKTFNPQASVKVTGTASGITPSDMIAAGNAFGKSHVQGFDKVGFHSGTPPPTSFSLALATGTQGGALGQPAIYGTPYMPMMPHQQQQQQQQTHSQLMHHAMAAQDSSLASRGLAQQQQANALQQQQAKVGSNKTYANPYWAGGN